MPFKMHKIVFFPPKKFKKCVPTVPKIFRPVTRNQRCNDKLVYWYEGVQNVMKTPSTKALGFYVIYQTKDQSVAVML